MCIGKIQFPSHNPLMNLKDTNPCRATVSRRAFIKTATFATGCLCAAGAFPGLVPAATAAGSRRALTVSCRDAHLKATGEADCWSALKALGATGVEVVVNDKLECFLLYHPTQKYSVADADDIKALKKELAAQKLRITAFCMNNRFDERLEQELALTKALLPAAKALGVRAIRLDVVPHKLAKDKFLPFAVSACKSLCDLAEGTDVHYGIENHGNTTNDPVFLEELFTKVGSPRLGLTLDPNNFYWYGHPLEKVYAIIEQFADRCFHTHCKNIKYPVEKRETTRPIGWEYDKYSITLAEGDLDYRRILALLRKGHYQGDLCLENECLGHYPAAEHPAVLKRETAFLRELAVA
jgi:sugar phosphate isomerase/epimerase